MTSYSPGDIANGYCGNCHDFTSAMRGPEPWHIQHGCPDCADTGLVMVDSGLVYGVHGGQVEQPCHCPAGARAIEAAKYGDMAERTGPDEG